MANSYLKPQSAIQYMDDFIYPLTTADQVIVDDKTRLSAILPEIQFYIADFKTSTGGAAINAGSIQGNTLSDIYNTLHPVGSIYTTSSNSNPEDILGFGTWELVGKGFKDTVVSDSDGILFTHNTTNTTSAGVFCSRAGSSITIRLHIHNKVKIDTAELVMGSFNWEAMGITQLPGDLFYLLGGSVDGADAFTYRVYSSGAVHIWKYISSAIAAGKDCYCVFEVTVPHTLMLDSACDKFYWKRIA